MKSFTVQERVIRRASGSSVQPSTLRTIASASSRERAGTPPSQGTQRFFVSSSWVGVFMGCLLVISGDVRSRYRKLSTSPGNRPSATSAT